MIKKLLYSSICVFLFITKTHSQTNISLFDLTLLNGNTTINFGIEKQFNRYQATVLIPYSDPLYAEFKESGAKRFFNARLGYFVLGTEGKSRTANRTVRYKVQDTKSRRIENRTDRYSVELTEGFAVLCGADYYQTFVQPHKNSNLSIYDNLTVGSLFTKLYLTSTGKGGTSRYFIDLSYGVLMNLANPVNKDTEFKRFTMRLGVDLYVFDFISTKICVGKVPGISGKNGWATLINFGFPLKL